MEKLTAMLEIFCILSMIFVIGVVVCSSAKNLNIKDGYKKSDSNRLHERMLRGEQRERQKELDWIAEWYRNNPTPENPEEREKNLQRYLDEHERWRSERTRRRK